ncbi:MAG: hypothetical protein AAGA85_21295, partial [Bacteroidota bacterium]
MTATATLNSNGWKALTKLLLILLLSFPTWVAAQQSRFPANVSPTLGLPYSLFVSDYTDPGKQQVVANILFNDFNEAQWTFKLKLRIEGFDIQLETKPGFTPSFPIVVSPGEPVRFTGADWTEYFDYRNLTVSGSARNELFRSGRLPEGGYTLYVQVLDYDTGEPLSAESAVSWWMGLFNPPLVMLPQEDAFINPINTQIPFTWQLFNISSPNNLMGVEHQLTLWEIVAPNAADVDPLSAVQNGQALEVFQSPRLSNPSFIYSLAEPALEAGKGYIYQVQAFDPEGRDSFKNEGRSEFRRFYYGWPTNGNIVLRYPENERQLRYRDDAGIQWYPPDNKLPMQPVAYEIRVAEREKGESPQEALRGKLWQLIERDETTFGNYLVGRVNEPERTKAYAWEVIGYSNGQEVGRSAAQTFYGPPLLEQFYAGVQRVVVDYLSNDDPDDLSGKGRVRLTKDPNLWTDFEFEHLKVRETGTFWVLEAGEMRFDGDVQVDLQPYYAPNGVAKFRSTQFRLNREGLYAYGRVEWPLHLASWSGEQAIVTTKSGWYNYDYFEPVGRTTLTAGNTFDLLDPFGFTLELDTSSYVWVNEDSYRLEMSGYVHLPSKIAAVGSSERVKIPFLSEQQIFYFSGNNLPPLTPLQVNRALNIHLQSDGYTIDLSDTQSPGAFSADPYWKGVQFDQYTLRIPRNFDPKGRLALSEPVTLSYNAAATAGGGMPAHVSSGGMYFDTDIAFGSSEFTFSTFPGAVDRFYLHIEASEISEKSALRGTAMIPVLNQEASFPFQVPMTRSGFMAGFFEGLEDYRFVHNPGVPEQQILITVKRAVMEEDERLSLTMDMKWPHLGIEMNAVRYFKIWGNQNIGFYTPEGIYALDQQLRTEYEGYPVTIDALAAGRSSGLYGFGVSGKINLGENVAGPEGAPNFNIYSLVENPLLPGDYVPDLPENNLAVAPRDPDVALREMKQQLEAEKQDLMGDLEARTESLESELSSDIQQVATGFGSSSATPEDMFAASDQQTNKV